MKLIHNHRKSSASWRQRGQVLYVKFGLDYFLRHIVIIIIIIIIINYDNNNKI